MSVPSKRKIATTKNQSTDTMRCALNPVGLWPSAWNINLSQNIFSTPSSPVFCYCALSVPDNSYDLTSDRDECGSYKVRPKIILSPLYLESTFIAKANSGRVVIIGKNILYTEKVKISVRIPTCFTDISNVMCPFRCVSCCVFSSEKLWLWALAPDETH